MNLRFEWDPAKNAANQRRHGVSFEQAVAVFQDAFAVERVDDRMDYGEQRFVISSAVDGKILTVVYTEREDRLRIISARRATRMEQDDYYAQSR